MKKSRLDFRIDEDVCRMFENQAKKEKRNKTQHLIELIKEEEKRKDDDR